MNRYSKQSILPEVSELGQKAIQRASVLCVGAGGLASPVLQYLVAAGVGRIGIVDADQVSLSNLQRQVLFQENQIGTLKVASAKANLEKLNSATKIETFEEMLTTENVEPLFAMYDIIVDGADNFSTKYLINDAAVKFNKPVVFASVSGFEGQVSVFDSTHGPCYRCVYPESSASIPNCEEAGVLGPVVGMVGAIQATECLKFIVSKVQKGLQPMIGSLLSIDARDMSVFKMKIHKNELCKVCSVDRAEIVLTSVEDKCSVLTDQGKLLIDVREKEEWDDSRIPGAVHLPLSLIRKDATALKNLDQNRSWVAYCVSGQRAREAVQIIKDNGFQASVLDQQLGFTQFFNL